MKDSIFRGCATALVTPMYPDGRVNYGQFKKLIEFQLANGVDALVVCGTTGESATLSFNEHSELVAYAAKLVAGRVPVIAGAGSNCTEKAVALARSCQLMGADALLVVTPYYNKTTQQGLIDHYRAVAACTDLPVIAYSVPSRTGMSISPDALRSISETANMAGIKDASGDFAAYIESKAKCPEDFSFYSGNDDTAVPFMSMGGAGLISVLGNLLPATVSKLSARCLEGDFDTAARIQQKLWRINKLLFKEPNPIPVKAAMKLVGIDAGPVRPPLSEASSGLLQEMEQELKSLGLI